MKNLTSLLLTAFVSLNVYAQNSSEITFEIDNLKFRTVEGTFQESSAQINIDRQSPQRSQLKICVEVASINTGISMRDNHLRSEDFFAAEQFPQICFTAIDFEPKQDGFWAISGSLSVKGKDYPLTVEAQLADGRLKSEFEISRIDIGVGNDFSTFTAGEMVKLQVDYPLNDN